MQLSKDKYNLLFWYVCFILLLSFQFCRYAKGKRKYWVKPTSTGKWWNNLYCGGASDDNSIQNFRTSKTNLFQRQPSPGGVL